MLEYEEIQREYLRITQGKYNEAVPIEVFEQKLGYHEPFWNSMFTNKSLLFKVSFVCYPNWKGKVKNYCLTGSTFTHIKIKETIV